MSKFVNLTPCLLDPLGPDPRANHQCMGSGIWAGMKLFSKLMLVYLLEGNLVRWSCCFAYCAVTPTHTTNTRANIHLFVVQSRECTKVCFSHPHTLTNTQCICNFKGWIEDPVASNTVQGRAYSISPRQFLTLTYRHCITFQYCTEACRQRTVDTSKGCGKSTFLLGASQLCHSCSEVGQRGTGRVQAWLKTSAAILKNGFSISHFDELKLSGPPVGRAWWFPGPAQLILRVKQRDDLDHKMCVTGQMWWVNIK